jgi:beta-phosphoglucomutase-like phosphatase (HAD superfamily)
MRGVLTDSELLIHAAAVAMFEEQGLVVQPSDFLPFVDAGEILTVLLLDSYPKQPAVAYIR